MDGPNEVTPVQIAIKKEPQGEESQETAKDIGLKDYAETTMNEMLGWYGYDKVEIQDTQSLDLNQFTSSISEDRSDENNENISVGLHVAVNENSNDRAAHGNELPNGHPTNNPHDYITCAWCQKIGLKLFTLCSSNGAKAFCSELCFSQCRRASFKKYKVCDWCKHIRHTVNYVDFKEGEQQLQFCSDKCLNQYKMNIFCKETEAHLQMHPLLPQDKATFEGSTSNSSPSSCANGSESASTLITPELWLQNCREPDSILPDHINGDEDGYGSDNDSNPNIFLGPDKRLAGPACHYRQKPENLRTYSRLREKRHAVSNKSDSSKPPCSPWLQQYYHRRNHRIEGKRCNDSYFKAGNCVRRSKRCISKADNCKDDAAQAYKKTACATSTRLVTELNPPTPSILVQSTTTNALHHLTPPKVQPPPLHQVQSPQPHQVQPQQSVQLTSTGPHFNLRVPSSMFPSSRPAFMFPHSMQLPVPLPQMPNIDPSAQQRLPMPCINPQQPKYMPSPPSGSQSNFFQQNPLGSILPPVTVMVPYPVFLPIPIPIPIPIPFPLGCKCKSNEGTNVGNERFPNDIDRNAYVCSGNANKDSDSQKSQSSEQKMTSNENVLTRLQESKINEDQPNESISMKSADTSLDLNINSFEEKHFPDISTHTLVDSTARVKMEPDSE